MRIYKNGVLSFSLASIYNEYRGADVSERELGRGENGKKEGGRLRGTKRSKAMQMSVSCRFFCPFFHRKDFMMMSRRIFDVFNIFFLFFCWNVMLFPYLCTQKKFSVLGNFFVELGKKVSRFCELFVIYECILLTVRKICFIYER